MSFLLDSKLLFSFFFTELESSPARNPLALSECGCSNSPSPSKSNSHERLLAQPPISPRALVTVAAHVRDLQEQVGSLELAVRDETATSNRLREQLKMEKEIRGRQDEEIALRFQNNEDHAATILQLTIDRERLRERCADLQESLAKSEKVRFKLEEELRDREERVEEVEAELDRMRSAEADKIADIRCIPCMMLTSGQHSLGSKNSQKYELSVANDAAAELSRLRIDYNLALQNMARFLRRSRMQQAALERAERREQQLLEEIRELRATCSAAKLDLSCIKDQLSPSLRQSRLTCSSEDSLYPDCGDYTHVLQRSRSEVARSAPSLLSWVLQSFSQNPEVPRHQNVQGEEEHLRQMQLLLTHTPLYHGNHGHGDCSTPNIEKNKRNQTEILRGCDQILKRKVFKLKKEAIVDDSGGVESSGHPNKIDKDKILPEHLPASDEEGSDLTLRFEIQVVPQSENLVPCTTHEEKTLPSSKDEDETTGSYVLLQDAWCQLEEARLFCETLETPVPLNPNSEFANKHLNNEKSKTPKSVRNVSTQAVARPQTFNLSYPDVENPLQRENLQLRSLLRKSRRVLEHTYAQLAAANERKRLIEDVVNDRRSTTIETET